MSDDAKQPTFNQRGFADWQPVKTDYGALVEVAESSAALEPYLWLRINQPAPEYPGQLEEAAISAHCTLEQAEAIRDQLTEAIDFMKQRFGE